MRVLRAAGLALLGFWAGLMTAAAVMARRTLARRRRERRRRARRDLRRHRPREPRDVPGGSMLAWFGGISVDLRGATSRRTVRAWSSTRSTAGSQSVSRRAGASQSNLGAVLGGVDARAPEPEGADAPTLTLDGFALRRRRRDRGAGRRRRLTGRRHASRFESARDVLRMTDGRDPSFTTRRVRPRASSRSRTSCGRAGMSCTPRPLRRPDVRHPRRRRRPREEVGFGTILERGGAAASRACRRRSSTPGSRWA